jgi:ribosomal protein S18 acetylase RimI-like enzyme
MHKTRLIPAGRVPVSERASLLNAGYVDYYVPMHMTAEGMQSVDRLYDVDLGRSVVALDGEQPVGMALLSCRDRRGWISGVGVLPACRRRGIGRQMVETLLGAAREAGVGQVTLEAIDRNAAARALYASLGFAETRELLTWHFPAGADPLPIPAERLSPAPADALLAHFDGWHDQPPCWQGEVGTLCKMAERLRGYGLEMDGRPAGYCLAGERGDTVALMDVGINPDVGSLNAGRILVQALAALYPGRGLSVGNVPVDSGLNRVLAALHFLVTVRQLEMGLALEG